MWMRRRCLQSFVCGSSPIKQPVKFLREPPPKQIDGSSARCQLPTGPTFISRRAGDVCQRDTNISAEAPLVHSGGVRDTSVHNSSVKCSLSPRVRRAKSEIRCHPRPSQNRASDSSERFISRDNPSSPVRFCSQEHAGRVLALISRLRLSRRD